MLLLLKISLKTSGLAADVTTKVQKGRRHTATTRYISLQHTWKNVVLHVLCRSDSQHIRLHKEVLRHLFVELPPLLGPSAASFRVSRCASWYKSARVTRLSSEADRALPWHSTPRAEKHSLRPDKTWRLCRDNVENFRLLLASWSTTHTIPFPTQTQRAPKVKI